MAELARRFADHTVRVWAARHCQFRLVNGTVNAGSALRPCESEDGRVLDRQQATGTLLVNLEQHSRLGFKM